MDLRSVANAASNAVNGNISVTVQRSIGFTIGAGLNQTPMYDTPVIGPAQVQALDGAELRHLENLNIQGVLRKIYLTGTLAGVIRPQSKGGDLITISAPAPAEVIGTWLVVKVLESWPTWTAAAIVLQGGNQ